MIICVTGTICSGKHTFGKYLAESSQGQVVNVDALTDDLYRHHASLTEKIVAAFGAEILNEQGIIDQKKLGRLVFSSAENVGKINALVHPSLRNAIKEAITKVPTAMPVIVIAALLKELDLRVDYVVSVTCALEKKKQRCVTKGLTIVDLEAILAHQQEITDYDFEVINNTDVAHLKAEAKTIWQDIKKEIDEYGAAGEN